MAEEIKSATSDGTPLLDLGLEVPEAEEEGEVEEVEEEDVEPTECEDCGDVVPDDDLETADGRALCSYCFGRYKECDRCSTYVKEDLTEVQCRRGTQDWCKDCVSNYSNGECSDCERTLSDAVSIYDTAAGSTVCRICRNENYFTCEGCGELHHDSLNLGDGYCGECEDGRSSGKAIKDYEHKPSPRFYGRKSEMFYGVELEVNTDEDTAETTLSLLRSDADGGPVYLKEDSSIDSGGYEIVTHPHTMEEHRKLWKPFFKDLPDGMAGYKTGECGMHVHIGRKQLTEFQIRKMCVFINAPENLNFITTIAQRSNTDYAKIKPKKLTDDSSLDRKEAFNVSGDKTVEVRLFRSSVREDRFFKNLEFVDAMVKWTKCLSYRDLSYRNFIRFVKDNKKDYPNLFNYLVEWGYAQLPAKKLLQEIRRCA